MNSKMSGNMSGSMSGNMPGNTQGDMQESSTFANVLSTNEGPLLELKSAKIIPLHEWKPPSLATETSPTSVRSTSSPPSDVDMLDCAFIDFHRGLKEYMMDAYGLMHLSEAADLHTVIVRHVHAAETSAPMGTYA